MYRLIKADQGQFTYKNETGNVRIQVFLDAKDFCVRLLAREGGATGKTMIFASNLKHPFFYFFDTAKSVPEEKQDLLSEFYEEELFFLKLAERWEKMLMLLQTLDRCRSSNPGYLKEICKLFYVDSSKPQAEEKCIKFLLMELSKYDEFQSIA